ncbi:MAG: putative amidohydrolase [Microbacterium sp.]|nr:putative amidohydrolase [Microbacterium sp.]
MTDHGFGLAVAQFAPTASRATNLWAIADAVETAAARGARVIVFPEYSSYFVDPFDATLAENAEDLDGPFTAALRSLAAERDVVLVAFGQRESDWVAPGEIAPPETFEVDGLRFGLMTCYDLRFPEVGRTLADAQVDVVLVPAEWVRGPLKEHHWRTLVQARAIENTVFVAGADHPPPLGVGHSMIVDPQGVVLAAVGTATDVAVAHIDPDAIARVRRVNPALELRRYRVTPR